MKNNKILSFILGVLLVGQSAHADTCSDKLVTGAHQSSGDAAVFCSVFGSAITQSLLPSATNTYDLGSDALSWRSAYLDTDIILGAAVANIRTNTSDGGDTKGVIIAGGGAGSATRGAFLSLEGEQLSSGSAQLSSSAVGGADVYVDAKDSVIIRRDNTVQTWSFGSTGNLTQDATNGDHINITRNGYGIVGPSDGALVLRVNGTSGTVRFSNTSSADMWSFNNSGALTQNATNGGNIVLTKASTSVAQPASGAISAAGSTQGDATALTFVVNNVETVTAGQGVRLWDAPSGSTIYVQNYGASDLELYPPTSQSINSAANNAPITLAAATDQIAICTKRNTTNWMCIVAAGPAT